MGEGQSASLSVQLQQRIHAAIARDGGWLPFDRFMALALYAPGLGYYARGSRQFGAMPGSGSDFVTAPELSPLYGAAVARQVAQALDATTTDEVWEFGAGSGALALQVLQALGERVQRYTIVDLSGSLRARQRERLAPFGARVRWLDALPETMRGVVLGNEVLDAMPVQLLHWDGSAWFERGVALAGEAWRFAPLVGVRFGGGVGFCLALRLAFPLVIGSVPPRCSGRCRLPARCPTPQAREGRPGQQRGAALGPEHARARAVA